MRLLPTKHTHPDKTIISVSYILLGILKQRRIESFDKLFEAAQKKSDGSAKLLFMPAINFLFLLDLVVYHSKNDSFEYTGK